VGAVDDKSRNIEMLWQFVLTAVILKYYGSFFNNNNIEIWWLFVLTERILKCVGSF